MKAIVETLPFTDENGTVFLAYRDYGAPRKPTGRPLVCVHGLTRNARDFDAIGEAMRSSRRVVSIDVAGRGRSGWLADKSAYDFETYLRHMDAVLDYAGLEEFDWLGTSMGGIIGMLLAAKPESGLRRLILNDVGPFVPKSGLEPIRDRAADIKRFPSLNDAAVHFREHYAEFGDLSEADWSQFTINSVTREEDGTYIPHYDPAIVDVIASAPLQDVDLWAVWETIDLPVLALRGETSGILMPETLKKMAMTGPRADIETIEGCGHAPALLDPGQISLIENWLKSGEETDEEAAG